MLQTRPPRSIQSPRPVLLCTPSSLFDNRNPCIYKPIRHVQHDQTPTIPFLLPSTMYPSFILTVSIVASTPAPSSAPTPGPQAQCRPSVLSYTFTTSSPAAETIRRASNIMLVTP